jgi:class 3 adenylate cyclase
MGTEAGVGSSAIDRRDLPTGTVTFLFTDIEGSTHSSTVWAIASMACSRPTTN